MPGQAVMSAAKLCPVFSCSPSPPFLGEGVGVRGSEGWRQIVLSEVSGAREAGGRIGYFEFD